MKDARGKLFRAGSVAAALAVVAILGSSKFHGEGRRGGLGPQHAAHAKSSHARVACPVCHAGGGRPAGRACMDCHPPHKAGEERFRVLERFAADRENSVTRTVLLVKRKRIHHAHLRPGVSILYTAADDKREAIPRVEVREAGRVEVYEDRDAPPLPAGAATHLMDCTDCHNRTAHAFDPPSRALDRALSDDTLSPALPFIKRAGLELLLGRYAGRAEALAGIRAGLARFYRQHAPETWEKRRAEIGGAAEVLAAIYQREWADHPDNLGHTRFPGCFRCHDGRHAAAAGTVISNDCRTCHEITMHHSAD